MSGSVKATALSARLSAVQAVYQASQNKRALPALVEEYINHRSEMEIDGEALVKPDAALLKKIVCGVDEHQKKLEGIIEAHLKKGDKKREIEPLLRAILFCGSYELMAQDIDTPIIINDYLNVGHSFYERGEVALINGVLDKISSTFK